MAADSVYVADSDEEDPGEAPLKRRRGNGHPKDMPGTAASPKVFNMSDYFKGRPASLLIQSQARPTRRGVKRESIESIKPAPVGENGLQKQSKAEEESAPNIESGDSIDVLDRFEGYTLRDLRRLVSTTLPRYGRLLQPSERAALQSFESMPLRAQQLFARLLCRKWPQWVPLEGLGSRYRELSTEEVVAAVRDLSEMRTSNSVEDEKGGNPGNAGTWAALLGQLPDAAETEMKEVKEVKEGSGMPWLLDTSTETATSLLQRHIPEKTTLATEDNYGKLLLSALPSAELRRMGKGLGISDMHGLGRRGSKSQLVSRLCEAAKQQRLLHVTHGRGMETSTEAQLVAQALAMGRWVCAAPSPGRRALAVLSEAFRLETCGAANSSYVVFSTHWPEFPFRPDCSAPPLFADRESLDAFVEARSLVAGLETSERQEEKQRPSDCAASAQMAEDCLQRALQAVRANDFESAKFRDPFRRRYTAAWCYAEALHHSVLHSPAVGHNKELQASKIRRLRLLLTCTLCPSQRGRWYAELAKEVARCEGLLAALEVAAAGLAEGEDKPLSAHVAVDLTLDLPSSQEVGPSDMAQQLLPRDARWDLARRCRTLARRQAKVKKVSDWQKLLRNTQVAQLKAEGGDDGGKWLPKLVSRLIAEEDAATGQVQVLSAAKIGLPQVARPSGHGAGQRRMFDGFHLEELTVEELAMQHYFSSEGGAFKCGIHCEGCILRDLFGILLFDELFDCSVADAFVSAFQDAPLDLGTEAFYPSRKSKIERRLETLASMTHSEVADDVRARFVRLYGARVRGVRWDRYEGASGVFLQVQGAANVNRPPAKLEADAAAADDLTGKAQNGTARRVLCTSLPIEEVAPEDRDLPSAAGAIGGKALAAALRLLCEDYNSAGLPDLLLWSWNLGMAPRALFVEVKSERDNLARRQRLWLATLRGAGAEAEVCHVRDGRVQENKTSRFSSNRGPRRRRSRGQSESSEDG
ncbi:unnamed protein product [Symbiodinium natans]|uniref:Fanconi-associated nuclease n=1 Tax=Symbiodinium natans TaxID=878477 RepID=A0A812U7Q1_9DINO|nr:unnamed protein product [Symbiodinium natans]